MAFRGCGTAIVTPFQADGALDIPALRRLVTWQIEEGIDFLVACGSTGEAQTLSADERQRVVATVLETAGGKVPVVAGATSNDTREAVRETRAMCDLGANAILSAAPYYNKPTQPGLIRHFEEVADASTRPVILYNVPGRTAVNIQPATVLTLAAHANIVAIKEASGDIPQAMTIIQDRPEGFLVLSGEDALVVALAACGGDGVISVASNEVPGPMTAMTRAALNGDLVQAREFLYRLLPLIDANFVETNPGPVKAALAMMGRLANVLRLPLVPVNDATEDVVRKALARAGVMLEAR